MKDHAVLSVENEQTTKTPNESSMPSKEANGENALYLPIVKIVIAESL